MIKLRIKKIKWLKKLEKKEKKTLWVTIGTCIRLSLFYVVFPSLF
jgi:hypothetical protein